MYNSLQTLTIIAMQLDSKQIGVTSLPSAPALRTCEALEQESSSITIRPSLKEF